MGRTKQLSGAQVTALVQLIEQALDHGVISTEMAILDFAVRNRRKPPHNGELTAAQIRDNLRAFLAKMESGGRIGIAYYRRRT